MIYICSTIIILAIIILLGFYFYLIYSNPTKIQIDDRVYKDRLLLLKNKYNKVKDDYNEENEDISISIRELMVLIEAITDRIH